MIEKAIEKVSLYSNILMVLTSLHHIYGAVLYHTPWRLHVLAISIPLILVTLILGRLIIKRLPASPHVLFWSYWLLILVPSIALIGLFEGVYNHLIKNILFYSQVKQELLLQLFPPPIYQLPNDFWFELSGVLQAVVVVVLLTFFVGLTKKALSGIKMSVRP